MVDMPVNQPLDNPTSPMTKLMAGPDWEYLAQQDAATGSTHQRDLLEKHVPAFAGISLPDFAALKQRIQAPLPTTGTPGQPRLLPSGAATGGLPVPAPRLLDTQAQQNIKSLGNPNAFFNSQRVGVKDMGADNRALVQALGQLTAGNSTTDQRVNGGANIVKNLGKTAAMFTGPQALAAAPGATLGGAAGGIGGSLLGTKLATDLDPNRDQHPGLQNAAGVAGGAAGGILGGLVGNIKGPILMEELANAGKGSLGKLAGLVDVLRTKLPAAVGGTPKPAVVTPPIARPPAPLGQGLAANFPGMAGRPNVTVPAMTPLPPGTGGLLSSGGTNVAPTPPSPVIPPGLTGVAGRVPTPTGPAGGVTPPLGNLNGTTGTPTPVTLPIQGPAPVPPPPGLAAGIPGGAPAPNVPLPTGTPANAPDPMGTIAALLRAQRAQQPGASLPVINRPGGPVRPPVSEPNPVPPVQPRLSPGVAPFNAAIRPPLGTPLGAMPPANTAAQAKLAEVLPVIEAMLAKAKPAANTAKGLADVSHGGVEGTPVTSRSTAPKDALAGGQKSAADSTYATKGMTDQELNDRLVESITRNAARKRTP